MDHYLLMQWCKIEIDNYKGWANKKNLTDYYCVISKEDEEKISLFTSLGFHTPKTSGQISINDRPIETIRLIKK